MSEFRHLTKEERLEWYIKFLEEQKQQIEEELKSAKQEAEKIKGKVK